MKKKTRAVRDARREARVLDVAMFEPRTTAEGPGRRAALWVQGCPMRCPGCCNPEMLAFSSRSPSGSLAPRAPSFSSRSPSGSPGSPSGSPGAPSRAQRVPVRELARRILSEPGLEGVSFLGGEPFAQASALAVLARILRRRGLSVMVYTGFTMEEIAEQIAAGDRGVAALLAASDLVKAGRYDRSLPETSRRWIGSSNQVLHFLSPRYSPGDPQFRTSNTLELRFVPGKDGAPGELVVIGWPQAAREFKGLRKPERDTMRALGTRRRRQT